MSWLLTPDAGRAINVVLAVVALLMMVGRYREWLPMLRGRRFHWASTFIFCAAVLYGSLDLLYRWNNQVVRVALTTFALLWTLAALLFTDRKPSPPPPGGWQRRASDRNPPGLDDDAS